MKFYAKKLHSLLTGVATAMLLTGAFHTPVATAGPFEFRAHIKGMRQAASPVAITEIKHLGQLSGDANFGEVSAGQVLTRTLSYKNIGTTTSSGVYASLSQRPGLTLTYNSCGTQASPVSLPSGASCSMTLTWDTNQSSSLSGVSLSVASALASTTSVSLAGTVLGFNASGVWSSSYSVQAALTSNDIGYPTLTSSGATVTRLFVLNNIGTSGKLSSSFVLSGDTSQFKVTRVLKVASTGSGANCGATISPTEVTKCTTDDVLGGIYTKVFFEVKYAPTQVGSHTLTVTPISQNGAEMPSPLTLTGSALFDAAGVWTSGVSSLVPLTTTDMTFGPITAGTSVTRSFYITNTGTHGNLAASLALSGDTSQFRVTRFLKINASGSGSTCGATVSATAVTTCTADDIYGGYYPKLFIEIKYAPSTTGNHSLMVTPVGGNGATMPAPIALNGTAK